MADATDSKSVGSDTVSVQVRPPAPPRDSTNDRMISICCWVSCLFGVSKSVDISRDLALLHFLFLRHFEPKTSSQNQFRVSFRKYVKKHCLGVCIFPSNSLALTVLLVIAWFFSISVREDRIIMRKLSCD